MNNQELYNELMVLTKDSDVFYFQDFNLDGSVYRIFNYRLASYTEFLKPSAIECRGIMFEVDALGAMVRLASRPMPKFFNLNENPLTMGLDLSKVDTVELKADGSLMSSYIHNNGLRSVVRLKSKGSLNSEQAGDGTNFMLHDNQNTTYGIGLRIRDMEDLGYTVNLEWCAPHNRIVIGYAKPHLKVLNARNRDTGEYASREMLETYFTADQLIDRVDTKGLDTATFVQSIPAMQDDIEGYVCRIGDLWFKVKTEKYMSLHHAKDSVNNPRRLFEAIVDEGIDDLRSMFSTDVLAIQLIDEMQEKVNKLYNSMVKEVETFYATYKNEDRKTYAITGRDSSKLNQMYFGLVMNMYTGKEVDYKGFMKSKYKELGFRDTSLDKKED